MLASAALLLGAQGAGCAAQDASCGAGEERIVEDERYCLFEQQLIIEGFECPAQMVSHEVPGGVVCGPSGGPGGSVQELPDALQDPFDDVLPWCLGEDCGLSVQEPAIPVATRRDEFKAVYRSASYACVVDDSNKARCFGPGVGDDGVPAEQRDVAKMAVHEDYYCIIDIFNGVSCFDPETRQMRSLFNLRMQYEQVYVHNAAVCVLGDYIAPYDKLQCAEFGDQRTTLAQAISGSDAAGRAFIDFSIRGATEGRSTDYCGLELDQAAYCGVGTNYRMIKPGPFKQLAHSYIYDCALSARDGSVQCWEFWSGEEIGGPQGVFEELYSPSCGLRDDNQVVCWDYDFMRPQAQRISAGQVIYAKHPRSFSALNAEHWCAIDLDGALECSAFRQPQ